MSAKTMQTVLFSYSQGLAYSHLILIVTECMWVGLDICMVSCPGGPPL